MSLVLVVVVAGRAAMMIDDDVLILAMPPEAYTTATRAKAGDHPSIVVVLEVVHRYIDGN